jgi:hypothetical protein
MNDGAPRKGAERSIGVIYQHSVRGWVRRTRYERMVQTLRAGWAGRKGASTALKK